jgi:putative transposase
VRRGWIESETSKLSVARQCALAGLARSTWYYEPVGESAENLELMRVIDELHTGAPVYGSPKMTEALRRLGWEVNHKRVERLMRAMGLRALSPRLSLSRPGAVCRKYPYLLAGMKIERPDQVWATDITYIRMARGFLYLVAVMDWFSRYVLAWELSNSLEVGFCLDALNRALRQAKPEIFNTDQGSQFTSLEFTGRLESEGIAVSMDGRGRCFDNIFVERLWRTVKYEEVYLKDYASGLEAMESLEAYFEFYNRRRLHQSLDYRTPQEVYSRN